MIRREQRESARLLDTGTATSANGDLPTGRLSRCEAQGWEKHYLNLVGLPLPSDARLIQVQGNDDFTYLCPGAQGVAPRTLRVWVDPRDSSLLHLQNMVYRRYPGHRRPSPPRLPLNEPGPYSVKRCEENCRWARGTGTRVLFPNAK
jgi:hypothetical protein